MTKSEIRKAVKEQLKTKQDSLSEYSQKICKKILKSQEFTEADFIFAYSALADEVDLSSVIYEAFKVGKKIALPKVLAEKSTMIFCEISENEFTRLKEGYYGILEPDNASLDINNIDGNILILTPGRAFTSDGKRLGRGKGFYDKFFSDITKKEIKKMGVCFNFQILAELPVDEFDINMDGLYTN